MFAVFNGKSYVSLGYSPEEAWTNLEHYSKPVALSMGWTLRKIISVVVGDYPIDKDGDKLKCSTFGKGSDLLVDFIWDGKNADQD